MITRRVHRFDHWDVGDWLQQKMNKELTNGERIVAVVPADDGNSLVVITEDYGLGPRTGSKP